MWQILWYNQYIILIDAEKDGTEQIMQKRKLQKRRWRYDIELKIPKGWQNTTISPG